MKRLVLVMICFLFVFYLNSGPVFANKPTVSFEGPSSAEKGSEVVLEITVVHSANSFVHHTEWLKVRAGDKPLQEWDYSAFHLPDGATFTKEVTIKVPGDTEVAAEASCNIHGSRGPVTFKILTTDAKTNP
jgi:desulfoferrodoxin (superoxide reductase-like protein)